MVPMETENVVAAADGVWITYRLDGCSQPNAPLVVLSNPSLVDYSIWNEFIAKFLELPQNKKYRILRYNTRGRSNSGGEKPLTLEILTNDLVTVLDAVQAPKAVAMTGISLGGMTVLNLALKYPERVATILPCDFFPKNPPDNRSNWESRVAIAQQDRIAPKGPDGDRIVGQDVADLMVRRWLSPKSLAGGLKEDRVLTLQKLVHDNSLAGFVGIVHAISSYDLTSGIEKAIIPAVFVAGADDQPVIPEMKKLASNYGTGAELHIIPDAGHLPVVEQPDEFVRILTSCLEANASRIAI